MHRGAQAGERRNLLRDPLLQNLIDIRCQLGSTDEIIAEILHNIVPPDQRPKIGIPARLVLEALLLGRRSRNSLVLKAAQINGNAVFARTDSAQLSASLAIILNAVP